VDSWEFGRTVRHWRERIAPATVGVAEGRRRRATGLRREEVADLRLTAARYPADPRLKRLISELAAQSPRFVELWEPGELEPHHDQGRRKVIDHPGVGRITLDCDTLIVAGDDLRIMIYTAEPGTEDAERLALAIVLGIQELSSTRAGS
jgi:MmyB-like transcription regulator ligand binding domain